MIIKQNLPQEFQMNIPETDNTMYVFWYDTRWHRSVVASWREACDFIDRARDRNVGAFASGITPGIGGNKRCVFFVSFCGPLKKYKHDHIALQTMLAHEFWEEERRLEEEKARKESMARYCRPAPVKKWTIPSNTPDWMLALVRIGFTYEFEIDTQDNQIVCYADGMEISFINGEYTVRERKEFDYGDSIQMFVFRFRLEDLRDNFDNYEDFETDWYDL